MFTAVQAADTRAIRPRSILLLPILHLNFLRPHAERNQKERYYDVSFDTSR